MPSGACPGPDPGSGRTTRFSSRPRAAIEALSSASARASGGVLRTFSGARPGERDVPDERRGPGGDEVHASLHGGLRTVGAGGPLRRPRACPDRRPAPAPGGAVRRAPAPDTAAGAVRRYRERRQTARGRKGSGRRCCGRGAAVRPASRDPDTQAAGSAGGAGRRRRRGGSGSGAPPSEVRRRCARPRARVAATGCPRGRTTAPGTGAPSPDSGSIPCR